MTGFATVSRLSKGYDTQAVDDFLDEAHRFYDMEELPTDFDPNFVRERTFPLVRGGYLPSTVDRVLERLDSAYGKRLRAQRVDEIGYDAWLDQIHQLAQSLYGRIEREEGQRFAHPDGRGYRAADVDDLLDRVSDFLAGKGELSSDDVVTTTFKSARGAKAYDMGVVDVYLDRVIQVLRSVE